MTKAHLAALALLAAACAGDLPPRSVLQDLRVLALLASPLEAGPGETVLISAVTVPPQGEEIASEHWTFCPFTLGPTAGDACALEACEFDLGTGASASADLGAFANRCLQVARASGTATTGLPATFPPRVEMLFRYAVAATDGSAREAVLRVPFYIGGVPAERNAPPVVNSLAIGGQPMDLKSPPATSVATVPKGGQLEVRVVLAPASVQQYQDSSGRTVDEQLFVSFYTTAGRFDFDRGVGLDENVQLKDDKVPAGVDSAQVYAVAHDDRGGATVLGPYTVSFTR
jgi:hypothetical protein